MEIGFSKEMLLDIGLNLAGFLTAGGLLAMFHSLFVRRHRTTGSTVAVPIPESAPKADETAIATPAPNDEHVEFLDLKNMTWNTKNNSRTRTSRSAGHPARNRQDVLRLAKQLLSQKHEERELKRELPITDGELAMVKRTMNLEGAGRSA